MERRDPSINPSANESAPPLTGINLTPGTKFVLVCPCCFALMGEAPSVPTGVDAINFYLQAESHSQAFTGRAHIPDVVGVNDKTIRPYTALFSPIQWGEY